MSERLTILHGDWIEQLRTLPAQSVHCCVTSPPYWGLRDSGVKGQLGLEKTPEEYVAKLVAGFQEVKRVLRDDGTLWINLGDCYATNGGHADSQVNERRAAKSIGERPEHAYRAFRASATGMKAKDLVGIPWMVAFALRTDGWYLRSEVIWEKPNPMPESVTDRPTTAHEKIFLFTKRPKYFFDAEAIKEPATGTAHARGHGVNPKAKMPGQNSRFYQNRDAVHTPVRKIKQNESFSAAVCGLVSKRNKRSVWKVALHPFKGAHFATFPPKLIEPCIFAGTSERGCCAQCGAPWKRIIETGFTSHTSTPSTKYDSKSTAGRLAQLRNAARANGGEYVHDKKTVGWSATCACDCAETKPGIVLDPFGGSGTTGMVALKHGRAAVLIELNPAYITLAETRCAIK